MIHFTVRSVTNPHQAGGDPIRIRPSVLPPIGTTRHNEAFSPMMHGVIPSFFIRIGHLISKRAADTNLT